MIAFGVDPMTGRASALAAGHGFLAGWAFAMVADMLYFAVIAITTLRLNTVHPKGATPCRSEATILNKAGLVN